MAIRDGSSARVRTYLTGAVLIALVIAAAAIGDRLDHPSPAPVTATGSTPAGPARGRPPSGAGARSTTSLPVPTGLPSSGRWIDYESSEGTGRLAVTDHRRHDGLTEFDVVLAATSGYQSYILLAYDDTGYRYLPESDLSGGQPMDSGVIAAGETLRGSIAFAAPTGPLTLVLRNDRDEAVAALRIE
ncbi:hypothetical protein [Raineyella sp. LH-20]|uniref:hypothetical protein n=1 Tax=Raineyella sp. LH-20 TaxID=3081204 RepID=UPI0029535308|nr:hypothetical protein [Raineyella sp. LH-20]WOP17760.1 hypothetical protein R0146_10890 [Raineyella sp. LH-20]